jgi:type VI secretion system secreted protein VgrG
MSYIHKQKVKFKIIESAYETAVDDFKATEAISKPFVVTASLVSENKIRLENVIKTEALLSIAGNDGDRFFHGRISNFMLTGQTGRFYTYQAVVVPQVWLLDFNKNFRIFQRVTVEEIVTQILHENDISSDDYDFRLEAEYQPRRYCTQYGESDFRFISRILEEEGIFYFFEHTEDSHTIVFSDTEIVYRPIDGQDEMSFNFDSGMVAEKETIHSFAYNSSIRPGKITHTNYNFKRPSLDLQVEEEGETHVFHEIYEYPGDYGLPTEGTPKVKKHLEGVKALEESAQGTGNCARFIPGRTFTTSEHHFDELNRGYCIVAVEHEGSQPNAYGEHSGIGGDYRYSNNFTAIPADKVFRTRNTIEKPHVRGLQSAIVTGPPGEEIYTDEYGRIKVQFHWDRKGENNERSSCWLRTSQPWSGNGWGMVSLPRVGDEVLVDFINGDPDWPIVVGNVNNAASPALYKLPANKSQSGIKSRSYPKGGRDNFNELRFEDRKGAEEVYLQSERDWNILVKNDKAQHVLRDESLHLGRNRLKTVGVDQFEQIGRSHTETIGANKTIYIGANKNENVTINSAETVGLAKELSVGGVYQVSVVGAMNETVLGAKTEEVGITKSVLVGSHMTEMVRGNRSLTVRENLSATVTQTTTLKSKRIILDADDELILKCGSAIISLKRNGEIVIEGASCTSSASGEIVIKGARTSVN